MATIVSWNGSSFSVPATGEENWGGATKVDGLLISLANNGLQKTGGNFTLSADIDFGGSAGLKSTYYKSRSASPASAGQIRLGNAELIEWRNGADGGNNTLTVDSSDRLVYNGTIIASSAGVVPVAAGGTGIASYTAGDMLYASAGTTLSKLGIGLANKALVTNGSVPSWALLVDANLDSAAAITRSKTAVGTAYRILANSSTGVMSENAALTATHVIYADANGQLAGEATLSKSRGGAGASMASVTFPSTGTLATLDAVQTFSSKSFSDPVTLAEVATPATPASGNGKVYFKSDGFLYQLNSAGTETKVGAGAGGINYITNNDAESATTGWANYADGAGTSPVDGTGGSPTVAISRVTASPLRGVGMFRITKDAANRQGQGCSYDLTIAAADKAKVLNVSFEYQVSAAFVSGDSSDIRIWVYDVTNSTLIPVSPFTIQGGSSGTWKFSGTFQSASNSTSYRLIFHVATTNASAWTFDFDNVVVGPQIQLLGAPIGDWTAYTPTVVGFGTPGTKTAYYRRVGDSIEVIGYFDLGTTTAVPGTISLPSGMSIDTAKIAATQQSLLGTLNHATGAGSNGMAGSTAGPFVLTYATAQGAGVVTLSTATNTASTPYTVANGSALTSSGAVMFRFVAPIAGWSTSVVMSNDTDTRVVAMRAGGDAASATSGNPIILPTVAYDTHGGYSNSTGRYTVPVSGFYRVHGYINSPNNGITFYIYVNAAQVIGVSTTDTGGECAYSGTVKCVAGDIIDIRPNGTINCDADTTLHIERLSGPAAIAATESINARYDVSASSANIAITAGATEVVDFDTKSFDTHGTVTTGTGWKFTAPIAGKYRVSAHIVIVSLADAKVFQVDVYKTGVLNSTIHRGAASASMSVGGGGSTLINLAAGDTIDIRVTNGDASDRNILTTAGGCWATVERIGN